LDRFNATQQETGIVANFGVFKFWIIADLVITDIEEKALRELANFLVYFNVSHLEGF
jgi:hypothetical protein